MGDFERDLKASWDPKGKKIFPGFLYKKKDSRISNKSGALRLEFFSYRVS